MIRNLSLISLLTSPTLTITEINVNFFQADQYLEKEHTFKDAKLLVLRQKEYLETKKVEWQERKEKKEKKSQEVKPQEEKNKINLPKGAVLKFTDTNEKTTREAIREALTPLGKVIYKIVY